MQTFRNLLLSAVRNLFLVWGTTIIALTWFLGRPNPGQIFTFYCFGAGLVLIHFIIKTYSTQASRMPG